MKKAMQMSLLSLLFVSFLGSTAVADPTSEHGPGLSSVRHVTTPVRPSR